MTRQLEEAERAVPPQPLPPGASPGKGWEPPGHGGIGPKGRCRTQNAAFCAVGGCGVLGEEGRQEVRGVLGGQKASSESCGFGRGWSTDSPCAA